MTPTQLRSSACAVVAMIACAPHFLTAQTPPEAYRTRTSQCRHEQPSGQNIATPRTDTGIKTSGYTAERIVTLSADAKALNGGEIIVCTEYGNVEITDSDNSDVRLQVRIEGFLGKDPRIRRGQPRALSKKPACTPTSPRMKAASPYGFGTRRWGSPIRARSLHG
jgi:hypothetical protein